MADALPRLILRIADLTTRRETPFTLETTAAERDAVAQALGIRTVRKLRMAGRIAPLGDRDWLLTADLGATVVQDCVVTLDPVTTRIDEALRRTYIAQLPDQTGEEVEMPDDDSIEPLTATVDAGAVMVEALSLALPAFPRVEGADLGEAVYAAPGTQALSDEDVKPFAGLGALRDALEKKADDDT